MKTTFFTLVLSVCLFSCINSEKEIKQHLHSLKSKGLACLEKSQTWIDKAKSYKAKCDYYKELDNLEEFNANALLCIQATDSIKYYQSKNYHYKWHYEADSMAYLVNQTREWSNNDINEVTFDTK